MKKIVFIIVIVFVPLFLYGEELVQCSDNDSTIKQSDTELQGSCIIDKTSSNFVLNYNNILLKDGVLSDKYWKRHKTLKRLAWTSLGLAVAYAGVMGTVYGMSKSLGEGGNNGDAGPIIIIPAACLASASIPLFIFSSKNKKKALSVSAGSGVTLYSLPNGSTKKQPVFTARICF